jgi:hypothetical protein
MILTDEEKQRLFPNNANPMLHAFNDGRETLWFNRDVSELPVLPWVRLRHSNNYWLSNRMQDRWLEHSAIYEVFLYLNLDVPLCLMRGNPDALLEWRIYPFFALTDNFAHWEICKAAITYARSRYVIQKHGLFLYYSMAEMFIHLQAYDMLRQFLTALKDRNVQYAWHDEYLKDFCSQKP